MRLAAGFGELSGIEEIGRSGSAVRTLPHGRGEGDADEEAAGVEKPADRLAPGFGAVVDEHVIPAPLKLGGGGGDVINVELKPGLRDGQAVGPGVGAEAG